MSHSFGRFVAAFRRIVGPAKAPGAGPGRRRRKAAIARAVSEALEARAYLTTFNAFLDAPATGHFGSTYSIHLFTSGGQASKWVVDWKDGNVSTYTTTATFATDYSVGHTYASGNAPSAAIAATATLSGSSTTAAAVYDLSSTYGTFQFQDAGRSTFSVSGDTITADYTAVDPGNGDEYVLFSYNPGGTSHKLMAIARFNSQGDIDNTWGGNSNGILY